MKKSILNICLVVFVTLGMISCKEGTKESTTTQEKEVQNTTDEATSYIVKNKNSKISWSGSKPVGTHTGTINISHGTFFVKGESIEGGKFVFDMNSINVTDLDENSGKASLEAHLKGTVEGKEGDFFNVNKYPNATFVITEMALVDGQTMMSGNLKMLDKTNNITFPVTVTTKAEMLEVTSEKFVIDRTKWGINYGSKSIFDNLGDKFISDDIELAIEIIAAK